MTLGAASTLWADDVMDEFLIRARQSRQEHRSATDEFIRSLDLTEAQARRLLTLLDEAAELHVEAYEAQAEIQPEISGAFQQFADEDSRNQGFSPEVERRTATLNHQAKEVREALVGELLELERLASEILSRPQLAYAKGFRPGRKHRPTADRRQAHAKTRGPKAGKRGGRRGARRGKEAGRAGSQSRLDRRLASAREELDAINRQIHPRLGSVGRYLLSPSAIDVMCSLTGSVPNENLRHARAVFENGTDDYPADMRDHHQAEITLLRAEINNWNLINGLHLSKEQIGRIVLLCEAFAVERDSVAQQRSSKRHSKRNRNRGKPPIVDLERAVEKVMNPGQQAVLADYKACLIPPKNLKDPVRVGQASDNSHLARLLTRARKMPSHRLQRVIAELLDREAEHFGQLSSDARAERADLLVATAREAAEMSDAEFEISKAEMAERIAPVDRPAELKKEISKLSRRKGKTGRVAQFMLKPLFIEQLRQRGRQLADGVVTERTDPASGPQAGNCEKGCALKPKGKKKVKKKVKTKP